MTLAEFGGGKNVVIFNWEEESGEKFCVKYKAQTPAGTIRILKKFRAAIKKVETERKLFSLEEIVEKAKPFSYKWLAGIAQTINIKTNNMAGERKEFTVYSPVSYQ